MRCRRSCLLAALALLPLQAGGEAAKYEPTGEEPVQQLAALNLRAVDDLGRSEQEREDRRQTQPAKQRQLREVEAHVQRMDEQVRAAQAELDAAQAKAPSADKKQR